MQKFKSVLSKVFMVVLVAGLLLVVVNYYPYIFATRVQGEIVGIKYLTDNVAIVATPDPKAQPSSKVFSFAVAIKDRKTGEIFTSSSEDRQWGVVKEGQCASAKFFPYPPWKFDKDGTYFNARLESLYDNCESIKE